MGYQEYTHIVDDWFGDSLIQTHVVVPVKVGSEGGIPWEIPSHSFLVLFDFGNGSTRDKHQSGVSTVQVRRRRRKVVCGKAATMASRLVIRSKHEMIDDQLLAALKKICEREFAAGVFEGVIFIDLHHRKVVPELLFEFGVCPGSGLFLHEKVFASSQPLLARDYLYRS